ncbi:MAG: LapA family protein [Rhodospirillales bacterium]|nr:LapA family protein [Rhodospirillales bacterium]
MIHVLKKIIIGVIAVSFTVAVALFSVANRGPVTLDLWPLPMSREVPLFALILASVGFGILWGGFAAWLSAGAARSRAREANRRAEVTEDHLRHAEDRSARLEADLKELRAREKVSRDLIDAPSGQRLLVPTSNAVDAA